MVAVRRYFPNGQWGGFYSSPDYCPIYWLSSSSHQCRYSAYEPGVNSKAEQYATRVCMCMCVWGGGSNGGTADVDHGLCACAMRLWRLDVC